MLESREYKGRFRLPTKDTWLTGILNYTREAGASLELQGEFSDFKRSDEEVILGETTLGLLTLVTCYYRTTRRHNMIVISEYAPSFIFEGLHSDSKSDMSFDSVRFSLLNLFEWINISGLSNPFDSIKQNRVEIKYERPHPIPSLQIDATSKLEIQLGYDVELSQPNNEVNFNENATATITYESPKNFEEIISKDIYTFQSFLSVAVHEVSYITSLTFMLNETQHKCFFLSALYSDKYKYKHPALHLVKYDKIKDQYPSVISNWHALHRQHENIIHLLVHSLKSKNIISEDKFMDVCRALELFHREIVKTTPRSEESYKSNVEAILSALTGKLRKWCKGKLMRNSHTLETRLQELYKTYGIKYIEDRLPILDANSSQEIDDDENQDSDLSAGAKAFLHKVSNTRNFYTHYDDKINPDVFKKGGLYSPIKLLKALLISCLFSHVGISKAQYESNVNDSTID